MRLRSRRAFLSTGAVVALAGCAGSESNGPPETQWRVEEEPDLVEFVHDGGDAVEAPERLVFHATDAPFYSRSATARPTPDELDYFWSNYRVDGQLQEALPERVAEGDAVVASGYELQAHFADGMTFQLVWEDVDREDGGRSAVLDGEPEVVLHSRELSGQRSEPPETDWATEDTGEAVRFVHDGGPPIYGPTSARHFYNLVCFRADGSDALRFPDVERRWIEEGEALSYPYGPEYTPESVQLFWRNRHGTDEAVLAEHVLESGA